MVGQRSNWKTQLVRHYDVIIYLWCEPYQLMHIYVRQCQTFDYYDYWLFGKRNPIGDVFLLKNIV